MRATNLTTITLPANTTYISSSAFYGCSGLKTLNLPYLTADDDLSDLLYAFSSYYCPALEAVNVAESEKYKSIDGVVFEYNTTTNEWVLFYSPVAKETFTIPASLEQLPSLAGCGFTTVTFEKDADGKEKAGAESLILSAKAFSGMTTLTTLELPSRLTVIGEAAFEGCAGLDSFAIPAMVKSVGASAFSGWTADQTIAVGMTEAEVTAEMEKEDGIFDANWLKDCAATVTYKAAE